MLVPFCIDKDSLQASAAPTPIVRASHERFLAAWQKYGVLVHEGDAFEQTELAKAIAALPAGLKKRWELTLNVARLGRGPRQWEGLSQVQTPDELQKAAKHIKLVLLDEVKAYYLGLPEEEISVALEPNGIEIARFDCADMAAAFQAAEALAQKDIDEGAKISEVWKQRFDGWARAAKHVVLVDRYAVSSAADRRDEYSGLRKLLVELSGSSPKANLHIYSSIVKDLTPSRMQEVMEKLVRSNVRAGLREVTLHAIPDRDFGRISHGRYVRFDRTVCELDTGIEVLAGLNVWRRCGFKMTLQTPETRRLEQELAANEVACWTWTI